MALPILVALANLLPMMPTEGPPLPKMAGVRWPNSLDKGVSKLAQPKLVSLSEAAEPWLLKLMPMLPLEGPPLPRIMGLRWPGR